NGDSDARPAAAASVRLHCAGGPDAVGRHVSLNQLATLVGRSPSCDLSLGATTFARVQVVLFAVPDAIVAVDLERRGHFAVNGIRCTEATVRAGDEIRVGPYRLTLSGTVEPQNGAGGRAGGVVSQAGHPSDVRREGPPRALPNDD